MTLFQNGLVSVRRRMRKLSRNTISTESFIKINTNRGKGREGGEGGREGKEGGREGKEGGREGKEGGREGKEGGRVKKQGNQN